MTKEVTSKEIASRVGVAGITLARWQKQGLIPPPEVRPISSGRGKRGHWPVWVIDRCNQIKQLRKAGHSLGKIKEELGDDWQAESEAHNSKSTRKYRFHEVSRSISMGQCAGSANDMLNEVASNLNKKHNVLVKAEHVADAVTIALDGFNPVLVATSDEVRVTADFIVADYLANNLSLDSAVVVVPLFNELRSHLIQTDKFPSKPTVRMSKGLVDHRGRRKDKLKYWRFDSWSFEVRKEKKPRTLKK